MRNKHSRRKAAESSEGKIEQAIIAFFCICIIFLIAFTIQKEAAREIDEITGNAISRVNISLPPNVPCDIQLRSGLNLVSFFCIAFETPRIGIVSNISNLVYIFEYQEGSGDRWKSYNPSLPPQIVQDLETMSRTEGYWVRVSTDEHFLHDGGLRTPTQIQLSEGWNLAGYPTNRTKAVNDSFYSIAGNYSEVRAFNANTQAYISHIPPSSGGLTQTTSGSGYWINASGSIVWTVEQ